MEGWRAKRGVSHSLEDLEKAYPRFWWKDIYPGGRFDCQGNDGKFEIIAESIRVANEMLQAGEREFYDAAFNRFFVSPGKADSGWGYHNWYPVWNALQYYMSALKVLIITPPKKANKGQSRYITLSCRPFTTAVCGADYPGQVKGAVYQQGAYAPDENVLESITFCDGYFGLRYTNDVIKDQPPPVVSDLGNHDIDTFERVIIHELTHAWRSLGTWDGKGGLSIKDPINDHIDPPKPVYGAKRTQDWAWLFMDPNEPRRPFYPGTNINRATPYTAECYAWMYQNRFFISALGWDDDGSPGSWSAKVDDSVAVDSVDLQETVDPAQDGDDFIPPFWVPVQLQRDRLRPDFTIVLRFRELSGMRLQ
ncbi:hypothetical protein F4679DRAFT_600422 [Xylaria curta]|nr:hypothetical protein F4679DRAFT_600422 [Xylaria curta]